MTIGSLICGLTLALLQGGASLEYARAAAALAVALQAGGGGQLDEAQQLLQRSLNIREVRYTAIPYMLYPAP